MKNPKEHIVSITAPITSKAMIPDGVTITETAVINPTVVLATTTSAMIKGMEIETISTTKITRSIITTVTSIIIEVIATTEIGISEVITTELTIGNATAAGNLTMDGEEEYDKHIVQLGARYATIAE